MCVFGGGGMGWGWGGGAGATSTSPKSDLFLSPSYGEIWPCYSMYVNRNFFQGQENIY